ncbi:hypothetical protein ACHAXT_004740 [Thalassiosira profunda]
MFDGSHRTNKREINLAGASASSRSSRTSNLKVARQQRLARAQAKAKLNGAKCLQRSWRGARGRREAASQLDAQFQAVTQDVSAGGGDPITAADPLKGARAASLLAFRMSPALLPFFASRYMAEGGLLGGDKAKSGAADSAAETCMRKDLLALECALRQCSHQLGVPAISPIATRRIISIAIVHLRQSIHFISHNKSDEFGVKLEENRRLVQLVDNLLGGIFSSNDGLRVLAKEGRLWTKRPSDYFMDVLRNKSIASSASQAGWMANIFLCFRDAAAYHSSDGNKGGEAAMDVDGVTDGDSELELKLLLKWCCQIILYLAKVGGTQQQTQPLLFQQGLALLVSSIFVSSPSTEGSFAWMDEQLSSCMMQLNQQVGGGTASVGRDWRPIAIHYLATSLNALSEVQSSGQRRISAGSRIAGLMPDFCPSTAASDQSASMNGTAPEPNQWMEALRDTVASREFIVMNEVLSHADACQNDDQQLKDLLLLAIPTILQYTLQNQPDLAILASFAAQGDDISSLITDTGANGGRVDGSNDSIANAAALAALGEDVAEESDDEDEEMHVLVANPQPDPTHKSTTTSSGRHSRADLQTLPKLDALYQTGVLRAKKATADRLRPLLRSHGKQVAMLVSLAEKIGRGDWIQQLGNTLFASAVSPALPTPPLLAPLNLSSWQKQAQASYLSALAAVMTTCSGIKAGRNAASPLLAKLAFHDSFLSGLWERSSQSLPLLTSQSTKVSDFAQLAGACEVFSSFCDTFSHNLLAVDDDDFLKRYYHQPEQTGKPLSGTTTICINAKEVVLALGKILNDLYWIRPVLASDMTSSQNDPESTLRFQRARLLLSGTKLWNSLYERWCRLYRVVQFCVEDCWWFPQLASRGRHDSNPLLHSQETTLQDNGNDDMDDSSVESAEEAAPVSADDAGGDALASTFRDPKMARVLTYIPQAMPFSRRVNLFNSLLESDKLRTQDETMSIRQMINLEEGEETDISGRERVTIRRDALYSDSKQRLNRLGKKLRKRVQVTFVNKHGQQEAGIDGGGVFKEFLDDLISDAFLPEAVKDEGGEGEDDDSVVETHPDFFVVTPLQTLKVNTALDGNDAMLSHYEFLGRVLGKSIYESILVEPQFCLPFLNKLLGKQNSLDDLKNIDSEYYKNLKSLRHMAVRDINNLGLTFELHESANETIELMRGGSNVPVTKENVIQYIHLVSHQKMNVRGSRQTAAFLRGFRDIIPAQWMRLFSAYELQKLISGDDTVKGIDVEGMMNVMRYSGGLHPSQPIVQWLWQVVYEMSPEQQRQFLKFMTSCSRQPLLGFGSMVPLPCIQQIRLREDDHGNDVAEGLATGSVRLPTSSTCMNLLKLPKYTSKEMLREKLLYAIEYSSGFELS